MNLLKPGLDVKQIIVDKSKMDREKARMKVKSDEKHTHGLEKLFCIGIDEKVDKNTLLYREVKDENGDAKLKKEKGE
jgi:hypothetical protein